MLLRRLASGPTFLTFHNTLSYAGQFVFPILHSIEKLCGIYFFKSGAYLSKYFEIDITENPLPDTLQSIVTSYFSRTGYKSSINSSVSLNSCTLLSLNLLLIAVEDNSSQKECLKNFPHALIASSSVQFSSNKTSKYSN